MASGGGQVPVSCSLCEEDSDIKWKCLNCDMLMCDKCKEKIHVKFKFAKDHKVVSLQEVGLHDKEIDLSIISCKTHAGQTCVMFCKSCDYLVCPLCISKTHNGHGLVTVREGYEILISGLKTRGKNVGTNIHELEKRKVKVMDADRAEFSKFENAMKKIKGQNVLLKKEVDQHTKNLETEITKKWKDVHLCAEKEEKELSLLIESLAFKKSEVDDIIQSNDGNRVFLDSLALEKSTEESPTSPRRPLDSIPTFVPGQITAYNIGSLENVADYGRIKIINQFVTELPDVFYMAVFSEDTLWITDQDTLQKVKIEGKNLKTMIQKEIKIYGMACTPSKDLLLITRRSVIKQISGQTGEMTDTNYEVNNLALTTVHVNHDGKVTVGAYSGKLVYPAVGRRLVIVMDDSGKHEATYEYDKQGKPLFTYVRNITRTKNGNICVVDHLCEDKRGRVVILSEDGDVLNTFYGHPEVNTDKIPFTPMHIFTSQSDIMFISNHKHNILYFLNSSGNLMGWCDTSKIGIIFPRSLCTTDAGHTYIGCITSEARSYTAKIYEVDIL